MVKDISLLVSVLTNLNTSATDSYSVAVALRGVLVAQPKLESYRGLKRELPGLSLEAITTPQQAITCNFKVGND